jgi:hypothetical protein
MLTTRVKSNIVGYKKQVTLNNQFLAFNSTEIINYSTVKFEITDSSRLTHIRYMFYQSIYHKHCGGVKL